jgi:hypothetical protein
MNRYILIDFEKNTLYNLEKVKIDFEENESQTSGISCINKEDLIIELKKQVEELEDKYILKDNDNIRICDNCHKIMNQGYCIDDGLEYYCSDVCLNTKYSEEEYNGFYTQGYAYYTTWDD